MENVESRVVNVVAIPRNFLLCSISTAEGIREKRGVVYREGHCQHCGIHNQQLRGLLSWAEVNRSEKVISNLLLRETYHLYQYSLRALLVLWTAAASLLAFVSFSQLKTIEMDHVHS